MRRVRPNEKEAWEISCGLRQCLFRDIYSNPVLVAAARVISSRKNPSPHPTSRMPLPLPCSASRQGRRRIGRKPGLCTRIGPGPSPCRRRSADSCARYGGSGNFSAARVKNCAFSRTHRSSRIARESRNRWGRRLERPKSPRTYFRPGALCGSPNIRSAPFYEILHVRAKSSWPPSCWRQASWPSRRPVLTGGILATW